MNPKKNFFCSFLIEIIIKFKRFFIIQLLISIFLAFNMSLRPYLIKIMLNDLAIIPSSQAFSSLAPLITLYIFIYIIMVLAFRFYDWIIFCFHPILKKYISTMLIKRMMEHSPAFYQNYLSGSVANKINDITNSVPSIINTVIDKLFSITLSLLIAIYTVWTVDTKFAIGLIMWIVAFLTVSIKRAKKIRDLSDKVAVVRSKLAGHVIDILTNITNICFFAQKKFESKYFDAMHQNNIQIEQIRGWFLIRTHTLQQLSFVIFQLICFYWLILGIEKHTITVGDFALIVILNTSIINYLQTISREIGEFSTALGNLMQGLRLISSPVEIEDVVGAKNIDISNGEIIFENVKFDHETKPLFTNLCLKISAGEKVGLVGYSGGGKSSFVNLILRLFNTKEGRIIIDNQNIKEVSRESLRKAIGIIPQDPSLFYRTILENIRYAKENASDEEVMQAAKKANAHSFICNLSKSYNTLLGEKGVKLSGGERQRIAIARVILKNSPILILDEATSHLDSITEAMVQRSLLDLMKKKTTIVIAHRLSTLLNMDRILVFDKGEIVQDGHHTDLIAVEGLYKKLWYTQLDGFISFESKRKIY